MSNRNLMGGLLGLGAAAGLIIMVLSCCEGRPRPDRKLPTAIGRVLAQEASSLAGPGGKFIVISRDTEAFPQPAIDILLASFQRQIHRANPGEIEFHLLQTDPLRPVEVPPGDFFELIRRSAPGHVIVSLLGPPVLTEDQRERLGRIKPKIVAFCSGPLAGMVSLPQLFKDGLLHSAVVDRRNPPNPTARATPVAEAFDRFYMVVRAEHPESQNPARGGPR